MSTWRGAKARRAENALLPTRALWRAWAPCHLVPGSRRAACCSQGDNIGLKPHERSADVKMWEMRRWEANYHNESFLEEGVNVTSSDQLRLEKLRVQVISTQKQILFFYLCQLWLILSRQVWCQLGKISRNGLFKTHLFMERDHVFECMNSAIIRRDGDIERRE